MLYAPLDLRRTSRVVGAIPCGFSLVTHQFGPAFRTTGDELGPWSRFRSPRIGIHTDDFGNDFPSFFHIHHVPDMQIQLLHHVGIVQRGTPHDRTGQLHRIHIGHRRHRSGTSDLEGHSIQARTGTLRLKLVSDGPTGAFGGIAQRTLLPLGVDLQHDAVRSHRQVLALHVPIIYEIINVLERSYFLHPPGYLESP